MILYVSESGGIVTKEYNGTPKEEAQNLDAAKIVADEWGCTLALLAQSVGAKTADVALYQHGQADAELWEIKTNVTGTKRSVANALRRANKQAKNMFLHMICDISRDDLLGGIKGQIKYTELQKIAIIKGRGIELFTRDSILRMMR